jgi:hypothetical protein
VANSEWRLANNETANFLEGSVPALPIMLNNCTLRLITPHLCTLARLHAYTLARTSHDETQKSMAGFLWLSDID